MALSSTLAGNLMGGSGGASLRAKATYESRLPEIAASLRPRIGKAVKEGCDAIAEEAKANAPVGDEGGPHPPGELRDSIYVRRGRGGGQYKVGVKRQAFYAMFYEWGTSHQPARPFMVPAAETKKAEVVAKVELVLQEL